MIKCKLNKAISIVMVVCLTYISCSQSYKKSDYSDNHKYYSFINTTSKRYSSTVFLINGDSYDVWSINVSADSTTWIDSNTGIKSTIKTQDINKIYFKNHLIGGIGGIGIGILSGLAIGAVYGGIVGSSGESAVYGAIGGVVLGAAVGLLVGLVVGDRKEYIIVPIDDN
jgi:hypothetical protein